MKKAWVIFIPLMVYANPHGAQCVYGKAEMAAAAQQLEIHAGDKAILHWDSFSIAEGELTRFIQPNSQSSVLNRVISGSPSSIFGTLEANGQVYLINPNGIIVGKSGVVNAASFIASTFDVLDADFIKSNELIFKGDSKESVINLGAIKAWHGDAILIGHRILNEGTIEAPEGMAALVPGWEVLVRPSREERIFIRPSPEGEREGTGIENNGEIKAQQIEIKADGNLYALAIKENGYIEAFEMEERGGKIFLIAEEGRTEVSGTLSARNGDVQILGDQVILWDEAKIDVAEGNAYIGGGFQGIDPHVYNSSYTYFAKSAEVHADGDESGNGGRVAVWSDGATAFLGTITARGGKWQGDGGFIEVSGSQQLGYQGKVNLLAAKGAIGTLLLDPCDLLISDAASTPAFLTPPPPYGLAPTITATGGPGCILNNVDLQNALGNSNVLVQNGGACVANGDITIMSTIPSNPLPVNFSAPTTLTITATNNLIVLSPFENNLDGPIILNAGNQAQFGTVGQAQTQFCTVTSNGDISLTAANAIFFWAGNLGANAGLITNGALSSIAVTSTTSDVNMLGCPTSGAGGILSSVNGPITVNLPGNLTILAPNVFASVSEISSTGGNITITTTATGTTQLTGLNGGGAEVISNTGIIQFNNAGGTRTMNLSGSSGFALIETVTSGDIDITNTAAAANFILNMDGGTGAMSQAEISTNMLGNINITQGASTSGINQVNLTAGTGSGTGGAFIFAGSGSININVNDAVNVLSTTGTGLESDIETFGSGAINITANAINVSCGSGPSVAEIVANSTGDININAYSAINPNSLTVSAGTAPGGTLARILTGPGNLSILALGNPFAVTIEGGGAAGGNISEVTAGTGNITIDTFAMTGSPATGNLNVLGTNFANATALVESLTGNVSCQAANGGNIIVQAGNATMATAQVIGDSVSMQTLGGGDVNVTGGTTAASATATVQATGSSAASLVINSSNNVNVTTTAGLSSVVSTTAPISVTAALAINVKGGTTPGGDSTIQSLGSASITTNSQTLTVGGGGPVGTRTASIQTLTGPINLTTTTGTVLVDGTNGCQAGILSTFGGSITISSALDVILQASNTVVPLTFAKITGTTGPITISAVRDVSLFGGHSTGDVAEILLQNAPITFPSIGRNLTLMGGSGSGARAQIGAVSAAITNVPITFNFIGGNVSLTGGTGVGESVAQIGTSAPTIGILAQTARGNITLANIQGSVTLQGGSNNVNFAQIGHSNFSINTNTINGDIQLTAAGPIQLLGGTGTNNYALIGHGGLEINNSVDTYGGVTPISIAVQGGNIALNASNAGTSNYSAIGLIASPRTTATFNTIVATSTSGSITLTANAGTNNIAVIGAFFTNGPVAGTTVVNGTNVNVFSAQDVLLNGDAGGTNFAAIGLDSLNTSANSNMKTNIFVTAGRDIILLAGPNVGGNAYFLNFKGNIASGDTILAIANRDMRLKTLGAGLSFMSSIGALTDVVDNAFPHSIGPGAFELSPTSFLTTQANAQLRVYTALRSQNIVLGFINGINGSTFIPSTLELVDDAYEKWCVFYPGGTYGGTQFTIYYKNCIPVPIVTAANSVNVELFYDLEPYTFWHLYFSVNYDRDAYLDTHPFTGTSSSYGLILDRKYWFRIPEHYEKNGRNKNTF